MSAALLPNGMQQFLDQNGDPLANGQVFFYLPGTSTAKQVWQDAGQTVLLPQPVILDGAGRATIYGSGAYLQRVEDVNGLFQWEQLTQTPASLVPLWGGLSTGTGNAQVVEVPDFTSLDGQQIIFQAGGSNSGPTTLKPNSTTAPIPVVKDGSGGPAPCAGNEIETFNIILVTYTVLGAQFHIAWHP